MSNLKLTRPGETGLIIVEVPTVTVIVYRRGRPNEIVAFESSKHGGKKVLPGGRKRIGRQNWLETAVAEIAEEIGLTVVAGKLQLFSFASIPLRDVRRIMYSRYLDGLPLPTGMADFEVEAHYGSDVIFFVEVDEDAELKAVDGEAKKPRFVDVRTTPMEQFALDHGLVAAAWRNYVEAGQLPPMNAF